MVTTPATPVSSEARHEALLQVTETLLPALRRLDNLLSRAIAVAAEIYGPPGADPFRGLYVDRAEVEQLLEIAPGESLLSTNGRQDNHSDFLGRFERLRQTYHLAPFDLDVLLLALAPELDRRYERVYAYLQNHVSLRRPTVDLALGLFGADAGQRLERRAHFAPDAPLIRHHLLRLLPKDDTPQPSLLAHQLRLDEQIVRFLLLQDGLDARLASFCHLHRAGLRLEALPWGEATRQQVVDPFQQAWAESRPLRLYLHGPAGVGRRDLVLALAQTVERPLLAANLNQAARDASSLSNRLRLVLRYARLYGAIPYLHGVDALRKQNDGRSYRDLLSVLQEIPQLTLLAGQEPWQPAAAGPSGLLSVRLDPPGPAGQRLCWQTALAAHDLSLVPAELERLSGRFRLTPAQIRAAVATASYAAAAVDLEALAAAARSQTGQTLAALAQPIKPLYSWEDIVLPADALAQLREICERIEGRGQVLEAWGFGRKLARSAGTNALFAGPSGTGKTMAAEIIANELGLDLYRIDLAQVVSKYIGETEKNLAQIFRAAAGANAILFFDEADALFGKRSQVRDSHDRYANIEISYLLQQMESYEGLAILATNLHQNLDEAFTRRLAFTIYFPLPDDESRLRIWRGIWPADTPLASSVRLEQLAQTFELSGGNIKNVALAAAYRAAGDGGVVTMEHLLHGVRREYQKLGRTLSAEALSLNGTSNGTS